MSRLTNMRELTFDRDHCLACRSCELACAVAHSQSGALFTAIAEEPAPRRRVSIAAGPAGVAALRCLQCDEPLCVFSCKSGALHRDVGGGVGFDESRCVGCLMCAMVCPWGIVMPAFAAEDDAAATAGQPSSREWEAKAAQIVRCDVCADRETPACVAACPTKAMGVGAGVSRPEGRNLRLSGSAQPGASAQAAFTGHLVVVGSSAAGIAACEAARELAPECRITMVTADAGPYSRALLPYALSGRIDRESIAWRTRAHLETLGVEAIEQARAVALVPAEKRLIVEGGSSDLIYDRLVIATGARAVRLTVPGADLPGVFTLREFADLEAIESMLEVAAPTGSGPLRAVVVGGGNVGLQAAEALVERGVHVTVVARSPYLLSQMADEEVGRRVGELFAQNGVIVRTRRDVVEVLRRTAAPSLAVRLDDGETLEADLVIVGKGVQPNVEWLRSSGLDIARGVVVDRAGATSIGGVFAAGDCAEVDDPVTGRSVVSAIWPVAYETGRAAGSAAVGANRPSAGALRMNSAHFFDTAIISIGEPWAERARGATEHVVAAGDEVYRKLVINNDRVIGALLYGDVSDAGLYYRLYRAGVALGGTRPDAVERDRREWIAALAESA